MSPQARPIPTVSVQPPDEQTAIAIVHYDAAVTTPSHDDDDTPMPETPASPPPAISTATTPVVPRSAAVPQRNPFPASPSSSAGSKRDADGAVKLSATPAQAIAFGASLPTPPAVAFGAALPVAFGASLPPAVAFGASLPPAVAFGASLPTPPSAATPGRFPRSAIDTSPRNVSQVSRVVTWRDKRSGPEQVLAVSGLTRRARLLL